MASPMGGASTSVAATVPVLLVKHICDIPGHWPEGSNPTPQACKTPTPRVGLLGIGLDRTGFGTCLEGNPTTEPNINPNVPTCGVSPAASQNYKHLPNLSAMKIGQMSSGYILTQKSVVSGLTSANAGSDRGIPTPNTYAFEQLVSTGSRKFPTAHLIGNQIPDLRNPVGSYFDAYSNAWNHRHSPAHGPYRHPAAGG